jgi:large subunit ribosomal protein L10
MSKIEKLVDDLSSLTVLEAADLAKLLEEKWGVSAAAPVAAAYAKDNDKLVILGGSVGTTALDAAGVKALATLPSLDELRGKIVGLLVAPATKIAGILQAPAGQLARVIGAYSSKDAA